MSPVEKVSLIVPVYNEEGNIRPLVEQITAVMEPLASAAEHPGLAWELWLVDDGSTDGSLAAIKAEAYRDPHVGFISFECNKGQTAAFVAGFQAATGDVVITLDADLQNDPADIPAMLERYTQGFDMVIGWRVHRQDTEIRRFASRIANGVRNALTRETVHDTGCSLKVMRASMARTLPVFKGMHRFLPSLMKLCGARISEMPVHHRPRHSGASKYGVFSRAWAASQDLLAVNWMLRRYLPGEVREKHDPRS